MERFWSWADDFGGEEKAFPEVLGSSQMRQQGCFVLCDKHASTSFTLVSLSIQKRGRRGLVLLSFCPPRVDCGFLSCMMINENQ